MASEAIDRVLNTIANPVFQEGTARVLATIFDEGEPMRQIRSYLGHVIWEALDCRDISVTLTKDEADILRDAIRQHVEHLNLVIPPMIETMEPLTEDQVDEAHTMWEVTVPFGRFPGVPSAVSTYSGKIVVPFSELAVIGEERVQVLRTNIQFELFHNLVKASFRMAQMDQKNARLARDKTGVLTQGALRERVSEIVQENPNRKVIVTMIDGDDLKGLNERYGHLTTDLFMAEAAQRIERDRRPWDLVGRWGTGDEFVHVAFDVEPELAPVIAHRHVRNSSKDPVTVMKVDGTGTATERRTVTVGAACGFVSQFDELIEQADLALFRAKGAPFDGWTKLGDAPRASEPGAVGRNRAWVYPSEEPVDPSTLK